MKVKFNNLENTPEELRYRELDLAFSEVADMAAQIHHEYDGFKKWIEANFKRLQLAEASSKTKAKEAVTQESVEVEYEEEEVECANILDPLSQNREGRPRKNTLKPTIRRSKKKCQVSTGTSTRESVASNPIVRQPSIYCPAQQVTLEQSMTSQFQIMGHGHAMGMAPIYRFHHHQPRQDTLHMYGFYQSYGDQRNNMWSSNLPSLASPPNP